MARKAELVKALWLFVRAWVKGWLVNGEPGITAGFERQEGSGCEFVRSKW